MGLPHPGAEATLAQIASLSGSIDVSQIDSVRRTIAPFEPLISAVGGSLELVAGDFADADIQTLACRRGPFDHVVCTDVVRPMHGQFSESTAMLDDRGHGQDDLHSRRRRPRGVHRQDRLYRHDRAGAVS